jgi:hypothetical protein
MFDNADSHTLDAVIARLAKMKPVEFRPESGRVFVVRDSFANFLVSFYRGRARVSSYQQFAMPFNDLRICATFGKFWQNIAHPAIRPLHVLQIDLPPVQKVQITGIGKSPKTEQAKLFWRI